LQIGVNIRGVNCSFSIIFEIQVCETDGRDHLLHRSCPAQKTVTPSGAQLTWRSSSPRTNASVQWIQIRITELTDRPEPNLVRRSSPAVLSAVTAQICLAVRRWSPKMQQTRRRRHRCPASSLSPPPPNSPMSLSSSPSLSIASTRSSLSSSLALSVSLRKF
jgi:hypothetical protein